MPVIAPARSFEGSDLSTESGTKIIKEGIPLIVVSTKENVNGIHLFFMPPYKLDSQGNGVWFKKFDIRNNFGDKFKERYVVLNRAEDPAAHFEKKFKERWPELAKAKDEVKAQGKFKVYPAYGNVTTRVAFNVLSAQEPQKGVHVFELPLFNGASQIEKYHSKKDLKGNDTPLICDPNRCAPVYIQCKQGSGNPWTIQPDLSSAVALPAEVASSEVLINLDEIFIEWSQETIIEKLRGFFAPQVFDICMAGWPGFGNVVQGGLGDAVPMGAFQAANPMQAATAPSPFAQAPVTPVAAVTAPAVATAPAFSIPANIQFAPAPTNPAGSVPAQAPQVFAPAQPAPTTTAGAPAVPTALAMNASNPMAQPVGAPLSSATPVSAADALKFLQS